MELQLANGSHEIDIHRNTDTILSERRRGKLNENFQALRALLPPGTKGVNKLSYS
ncbi:hypothetical protein glysoja_040127 [Glycine soja]|uniref:BHLH domain-containing protein n=1 Tax=Glycine soja TaxID=3848 RepID=A0A0B2PGC0_GLYSO|nr:hypothetical protein glysoja_040127 [Glycine soja]